jgi:hypothetical protein
MVGSSCKERAKTKHRSHGRFALSIAIGSATAVLGCTLEASISEPIDSEVAAASSYFQNLTLTAVNCRLVKVAFNRVSTFNNRPLRMYRLLRNGKVVNTVAPGQSTASVVTIADGWFFPADNTLHSYKVEVENDLGQTEQSAALSNRASACTSLTHDFVIVKTTPRDLAPYAEIAADDVLETMFGSATSSKSVTSYFKEVSYGKVNLTFVEHPGWLSIQKTHVEYCGPANKIETAPDGKKYCAGASAADAVALYGATIARDYPGRKIVWVVNGGYGGGAPYNGDIQYGAYELALGDLRSIFHEMGHYFDLFEGWGLTCPTELGWFGPSLSGLPDGSAPSGCYYATYQYAFDPMSGRSGHHFYGMHKYQMGWLKFGMNVLSKNALLPGRAAMMTLKAIDDPVLSTSTQVADHRLGRYQLETNGSSYFTFEYRRNTGMNAVSYAGQPVLKDGIYMTYFAGKNPTTSTAEGNVANIYGDVLVPSEEPYIAAGSPYRDPDRQLQVTLESIDAATKQATIKIHKLYAYTGSCVVTKDITNYVSAGYPCFCQRVFGAFVDKTATTVECKAGATPTR